MALPSHIAAWLSQPLEARPLRPAQPRMRGAFFHPASGRPFCLEAGEIKARLAESTRRVPHQRDPQTRRRNDAMAWSTPEIREVCVGMEVTSYLSAEM
jgi:coenzyme PQQ precursor peptide PqqA